jgi:hypothetical protein
MTASTQAGTCQSDILERLPRAGQSPVALAPPVTPSARATNTLGFRPFITGVFA